MNTTASSRLQDGTADARHRWRWLPALLVLHIVLVIPDHPGALGPAALLRLPVELPLLLLLSFVWPARHWRSLRVGVAAGLALFVLSRCADLIAHASLGRSFNLLLDMHLAAASFELLSGAIGLSGAVAVAALALLGWVGLTVAVWWAVGALRPPEALRLRRTRVAAVVAALAGSAHLGADAGLVPAVTTADSSRSAWYQLRSLGLGLSDQARFRAELADDPFLHLPSDRLLARLANLDVLFVFVESYGRSTLELPIYAPTVNRLLADFERAAEAAGFAARSGWLTSPIQGGQSWLAHATLLAGLKIDNQRRHANLMLSDRQTLVGDFGRAGWRTLAVMPAIEKPWPEGRFYGFDRIYSAGDLGYAGKPFNWVTMPDQFTLSALRRLELDRCDRPPIMASVALISSHAPWTPIPPLLPWDAIGDGSVFDEHALSGDPPEVVWRDRERIRAQYLRSIDYVLRTLKSYLRAFGDDDALLVVLGDHQPAWVVTGDTSSFDVPIHVLARDSAVLDAIADWGWSPGMRPAADAAAWPMERLRERFLATFSAAEDRGLVPTAAPARAAGPCPMGAALAGR